MAHVEQDSELFTNLVSAQAIPSGRAFFAFRDLKGAPGLFSLGTDSVLNLFLQKDGKLQNTNFAVTCGFSDPVTALAVRQQADSSLFIAFSLGKSGRNQIAVLPNVPLASISAPNRSHIIVSDAALPEIHGIYLSDYSNSTFNGFQYPDVVLAFQPLDRVTKEDDCALLQFNSNNNAVPTASISKNWSLPVNTDKILDLTFARSTAGNGVAVLYQAQGNTRILYSVYDADAENWSVSPVCPAGATCLASYMNPPSSGVFAGYSGLLVGSTQITSYTTSQYVHTNKPGTVVSGDLLKVGLKDIHVAQQNTNLTIWFTNNQDAAGYYQVNSSVSIKDGRMVSLLPEGKGGRLSGMITTANLGGSAAPVNTLISVDKSGHLTSLQQSAAKGAWDVYPLMTFTKVSNFEVQSYTTRLRIMAGKNKVAGNATFVLKSSGRVSAIINGRETYLEEGGITLQSDASGEATFIVATADVSSHTFEISNIKDSTGKDLGIGTVKVDPSQKALGRLKGITDGASLTDATTQTGKKLIDPKVLKGEDIDHAGKLIGQLYNHANAIRSNTAPARAARTNLTLSSVSSGAEFWNWVTEKAHEAETWVIQTINAGIEFVVTIAGKVWNFILDSISAVGRACQWIFEKLKIGFETLIEYLGFIFAWDDIIATKNSLSAFLTTGINWASRKVDEAIPKVDQVFTDLKATIQQPRPSIADQPVNQGPPAAHDAQQSMGFNWSKYHLVHSGGVENYQPKNEPSAQLSWQGMWNDVVTPAIKDIQKDIQRLIDDIARVFQPTDSTVSISDTFKLIGQDLAVVFLDIIKNIVEGIMKLVRDVLKWIAQVGNEPIDIPIFSALYRSISGGHELTAFDGICLVLAIPATVLAKLITGKALPDISKVLNTDLFQAYIDGTASPQQMTQMNTVAAFGSVSAGFIGIAVGLVGLVVDAVDPITMDRAVMRNSLTPEPKLVNAYDLCNILTGLSNTFLAIPSQTTINKVGSASIVWGMWGMMATRWTLSTVQYGLRKMIKGWPKEAKYVIAAINMCGAVAQYGLQIDVATKSGSPPEKEGRLDAIATCYLLGTLCRSGATIAAAAEQPEVEAVAGILYCYLALGSSGLQLWNIYEIRSGGWWDAVPTVV